MPKRGNSCNSLRVLLIILVPTLFLVHVSLILVSFSFYLFVFYNQLLLVLHATFLACLQILIKIPLLTLLYVRIHVVVKWMESYRGIGVLDYLVISWFLDLVRFFFNLKPCCIMLSPINMEDLLLKLLVFFWPVSSIS